MIENMRRLLRTPHLSALEWFAISTRLLWMAALLLIAGLSGRISISLTLMIALWIGVFSAITYVRSRGFRHLLFDLVLTLSDITFGLIVIAQSGLFSSPLWSALLVGALGAGLSYGLIGSISVAALSLLCAALMGQLMTEAGLRILAPLGIYVGAVMLAAGVIGQLAEQILWLTPFGEAGPRRKLFNDRDQQRLRAIFRMVAELNATLNYERVLDMALDVSASSLSGFQPEDDQLVAALLLYDGDQLRVVSGRRLTHADWRVKLPGDRGVIGDAFGSGDPCLGYRPTKDPEVQRLVSFHPCRQLLCMPLLAGLEAYGVFLFGHPELDFFNGENVELLEAIAQQSMVALQNARLYRDLEQEKERIMQIEEEARKRLARELHDGPTQSIAALAMRLNFTRRLMERDLKAASQELFKVEDMARRTTKEIRHMLFTLRPLILESQGLVMALKQLVEKVSETHRQNVILEAEPEADRVLDKGKQGVVFYIAEEAVNNAVKHAEAEHIWVRLHPGDDLITLEIEDDGVGFNVGAVDRDYAQRGSLGMVNMRERTELINGLFRIESREGEGTCVVVNIPTTEEAAESLHRAGGPS